MERIKKQVYENPVIDIIEFDLLESIATSGDFGPATLCGEETF
jgi:hypothetical protein